MKMSEVTKQRKTSDSTILKSFRNNVIKLKENKMTTKEENVQLEEIAKKLKERWISLHLDI